MQKTISTKGLPMPPPVLTTPRLRLRCIMPEDFPAFAEMNADPRVMELLPKILTRAESDAVAARMIEQFAQHGFGKWAVGVIGGADFVGYVGLAPVDFEISFAPAVEMGWRLARDHWGCGYATEAGRAVLDFAFNVLKLEKVVSFTVPANKRSIRVMERLGFRRSPQGDFDHPKLPPGHSLRRHVLYVVKREDL